MNLFRAALAVLADPVLIQRIRDAGTAARWVDTHPWRVGHELLAAARARDQTMILLLADAGAGEFRWWSEVRDIEIIEFSRGSCESRVTLGHLHAVPPIWEPLDAVMLLPSAEQLHRESVEPVGMHRTALRRADLHPYAICETPPFGLGGSGSDASGGAPAG